MARSRSFLCCTAAGLLAFFLVPAHAAGQKVCSSQNTAEVEAIYDIYQSNGACYDNCKGEYALAIVQYKNCWCSNYLPEKTTDTGDCNQSCPGYPDDKCGNEDEGLFGYIPLEKKPSGTKPAGKPTSAKSKDLSKSTATTAPTTDTTLATTTTESLKVITISGPGGFTTIVQTPTNLPSTAPVEKKGTNVGAIVGGVVGGVLGLALLIGGIIFLLWRRRRQQREEEEGQFGVQRHTSQMSKSGLLRSEKVSRYPPAIVTNTRRSSRMMQDNDSISPMESGSDRRSSRPYIFDQRLNPSAIMTLDNVSRGSVASLDDSRDYGRTLNVRNPDPDPDK